jgi:hypothetical protein
VQRDENFYNIERAYSWEEVGNGYVLRPWDLLKLGTFEGNSDVVSWVVTLSLFHDGLRVF